MGVHNSTLSLRGRLHQTAGWDRWSDRLTLRLILGGWPKWSVSPRGSMPAPLILHRPSQRREFSHSQDKLPDNSKEGSVSWRGFVFSAGAKMMIVDWGNMGGSFWGGVVLCPFYPDQPLPESLSGDAYWKLLGTSILVWNSSSEKVGKLRELVCVQQTPPLWWQRMGKFPLQQWDLQCTMHGSRTTPVAPL